MINHNTYQQTQVMEKSEWSIITSLENIQTLNSALIDHFNVILGILAKIT